MKKRTLAYRMDLSVYIVVCPRYIVTVDDDKPVNGFVGQSAVAVPRRMCMSPPFPRIKAAVRFNR